MPLMSQMSRLGNASSQVIALQFVATQLGANANTTDRLAAEIRTTAGRPWAYELAGMHELTHTIASAASRREDLCASAAQGSIGEPVTGLTCSCGALFGSDGLELEGKLWGSFLSNLGELETKSPRSGEEPLTPDLEQTFEHLLDVRKETSIERRISADRGLEGRHLMATDLVAVVESSTCLARVLAGAIRQLSTTAKENLYHLMDSRTLGVFDAPKPPACTTDHCLETVALKSKDYERFWFPMKYMQFWDLSQKAVVDPCSVSGKDKDRLERVFRFTIAGLMSTHALTAHTFLEQNVERQDTVIVCPYHTYVQAFSPLGMDRIHLPGCENRRRASIFAVSDKRGNILHARPLHSSDGVQLNVSISALAVDPNQQALWACGKALGDGYWSIHRFDLRDVQDPAKGMASPIRACASQRLDDTRLNTKHSERCLLAWEPKLKLLFVGSDGGGTAIGYRPDGEFPEPDPVYLDGKEAEDNLKDAALSAVDCVRRRRRLSERHELAEDAIENYHHLWADTRVGDPHPRERRRLGTNRRRQLDEAAVLKLAVDSVCNKDSQCKSLLSVPADKLDIWALSSKIKSRCNAFIPCAAALEAFCTFDSLIGFVPEDGADVYSKVLTRLCDPIPHCGKGTLILTKVERIIEYYGPDSNPPKVDQGPLVQAPLVRTQGFSSHAF